jgi:hypothetical protein
MHMVNVFDTCDIERIDVVLTPLISLLTEDVFQLTVVYGPNCHTVLRHLLWLVLSNKIKENTMPVLLLAAFPSSLAHSLSELTEFDKIHPFFPKHTTCLISLSGIGLPKLHH